MNEIAIQKFEAIMSEYPSNNKTPIENERNYASKPLAEAYGMLRRGEITEEECMIIEQHIMSSAEIMQSPEFLDNLEQ